MSLDSVEILMKVEDTFGIKIHNSIAEQIITVGDFHNAVWQHVCDKQSGKCKSQSLFYQLRKSFADTYNFPALQLRLDTSPNEIFPVKGRRQAYENFALTNNLKLPELVLTSPWANLLSGFRLVSITGGLLASIVLIVFFDYSKWILLLPIAGVILSMLLSDLINPMRTEISLPTLRAFTQQVLGLNYSKLLAKEGTNRLETEQVINAIIADMAGLELAEITPEKKIGDDLGID